MVIAFILRLIYLFEARHVFFFDHLVVDARAYDRWAREIAAGDWLGGRDVFYQAPLYPYVLAGIKRLAGDDLWRARLVQIALGSLSCGVLFLAGRAIFSTAVGVVAGAMLALYPPAIFFDALIQKAVLDLLLSTLLLWVLARAWRSPNVGGWLAVGAVVGLLALTRENALLLLVVLAAVPLARFAQTTWPRRAGASVALLAGAAIVLLPVGIRNKAVGGEFTLTTSQAGPNFFIGNNSVATGIYAPLRAGRSDTSFERADAKDLAERAVGRALSAGEVSSYWFGRAFAFVREDPLAWLKLSGRKLMLVFNAYEIPDAEDLYFCAQHAPLIRWLGTVWHFGTLAPLAAAGIALTWPRRRELWILYAIIVTLALGVALFFVFARYRVSIVPPLMLFAAAAVVQASEAWSLDRKSLLRALFAAAMSAVIVNFPMFRRNEHLAMSYANVAGSLEESDDINGAIANYRAALDHDPSLSEVRLRLGLALARSGQLESAVAEFTELLHRQPNHIGAEMWLGTAYAQLGQFEPAIQHLTRATQLDPKFSAAATNLATLELNLGRWTAGVATLRRAAEANPDDAVLVSMLVGVLATSPDARVRDVNDAIRIGETFDARTGGVHANVAESLATAYESAGRADDAHALRARQLKKSAVSPDK